MKSINLKIIYPLLISIHDAPDTRNSCPIYSYSIPTRSNSTFLPDSPDARRISRPITESISLSLSSKDRQETDL